VYRIYTYLFSTILILTVSAQSFNEITNHTWGELHFGLRNYSDSTFVSIGQGLHPYNEVSMSYGYVLYINEFNLNGELVYQETIDKKI